MKKIDKNKSDKIIEEKIIAIKPTKFNIREELEELIESHQEKITKKQIQLINEIDNAECILDQGLFRQIAENLVSARNVDVLQAQLEAAEEFGDELAEEALDD